MNEKHFCLKDSRHRVLAVRHTLKAAVELMAQMAIRDFGSMEPAPNHMMYIEESEESSRYGGL